jgi:hypothetical protein
MRRNQMKKTRVILLIFAAAAISIIVTSCEIPTTTSIMDRLSQFMTDLNLADRSNAYLNFDATNTEYYAAIRDPVFWDTDFPVPGAAELKYSLETVDYIDPLNVTANMYGPPLFSGTGDPRHARFVMIKVGTDWMIHEMYLDGSPTATIKKL